MTTTNNAPCPFCGGLELSLVEDDMVLHAKRGFHVSCCGCAVQGPLADSIAQAVSTWNERKPPIAPSTMRATITPRLLYDL